MARHSLRDKKTGRFISKKDYQAQQKHIKTMAKSITNLINAVKNSKKSTKELNKEINTCIKRIVNETPKANSQIRLMDVGVKRLAGSFKMLKKPVKEVFDIFKKMLGMSFSGPAKLYAAAGVGTKLLSSMGLQELKSKAIGTGTTPTNLRALDFAEKQVGMQGYVSSIQEKLLTNLYNPSGWGSIATTLGLTNQQAQERYGGDTVEGAFKLIEDMQKHLNNVYSVHGRKSTEYEAVIKTFADKLGLSDEAVENLFGANRGGELVSAYNQSKSLKITEGQLKAQQAATASLQRLQVSLQNFLTVLSSPMLKLTNNFTKNLNKVTKSLGKKENQQAMNEFVGSVNAFVDELTNEGLKVLDWFFKWFRSDGKKSLNEWFNWIVSMIKKFREWLESPEGTIEFNMLFQNVVKVAKIMGHLAETILPWLGDTILWILTKIPGYGMTRYDMPNGYKAYLPSDREKEFQNIKAKYGFKGVDFESNAFAARYGSEISTQRNFDKMIREMLENFILIAPTMYGKISEEDALFKKNKDKKFEDYARPLSEIRAGAQTIKVEVVDKTKGGIKVDGVSSATNGGY